MLPGPTRCLLAFFVCALLSTTLAAQRPVNPIGLNPAHKVTLGQKMDCNDAGELDGFTGFSMESNSFGMVLINDEIDFTELPDTIFLCADDAFEVIHGGEEDLSGDPDPSSQAGVGYAFYECVPTATGPLIDDIRADPCVEDDGLPPFTELSITVPAGYLTGDYTLMIDNGGFDMGNSIPDFFPDASGNTGPVVLYIAPITFDDVDAGTGQPVYEAANPGDPFGPCVNVRVDQTFAVAYLKPLVAEGFPAVVDECAGTFTVLGGAPELRGNNGYTITIENTVTGETGVVTTPAEEIEHGATVAYEVPTAGEYTISVSDGVSCDFAGGAVQHTAGCIAPIAVTLPVGQGTNGTNQCYPVTVSGFTDIVGLEFEFSFDPAILQFTGVANATSDLVGSFMVNGPPTVDGGTLPDGNGRILYDGSLSGPGSLTDGEVLIELCFDLIGGAGESSALSVNTTDNPPNFSRQTGGTTETGEAEVSNGNISIISGTLNLDIDKTDETCDGDNDGNISVVVTTVDAPISASIRRVRPDPQADFGMEQSTTFSPSTFTFPDLADGDYQIRVVNGAGEEVIEPVTINRGSNVAVNLIPVANPSCNGFNDGTVQAEVLENGMVVIDPIAGGYRFAWEGRTDTTDVLTGLGAGRYEVTVTAPNGICMNDVSGNLSQPLAVTVRPDNPATAVSSATCDGAPDGSITISADGGTGPYEFEWPGDLDTDEDEVESMRDGLLPGEYAVIVTDTRGCADTANFVVDALKSLIINSSVDSISCFGEEDGIIRVSGSAVGSSPVVGSFIVAITDSTTGVTQPEQEILDNTVPFEFTGLAPGTYVVTLRDEDPVGCSIQDTFRIGEPEELEFSEDLETSAETCSVGMDGTAEATVVGGTTPYTYAWTNDSLDTPLDTITLGPLLDSLSADSNYVLTVTDARGCVIIDSFEIRAPAGSQINPIPPAFISCPGDMDGQLSTTVIPPPGEVIISTIWYRLNADSTLGAQIATGNSTEANLGVGLYALEVISSNDCPAFAIGAVTSPGLVFLQDSETLSPECPGETNGTITVTPGGGTPNADGSYNYVWSTDPETTTTVPVLSNLVAGTYSVTISDANNCQPPFDTTFVLTDPPAITGEFTLTAVSCPDDEVTDGQATFTAAYSDGSAGSFDFTWPSGTLTTDATSSTETDLGRGEISVTVTDGICAVTFVDTISSPEAFVTEIEPDDVSCNGLTDGAATLNVSGGTGDYTFEWAGLPDTDNTVEGLPTGDYQVVVTDENGCSPPPVDFTIAEPDVLMLSLDSTLTSTSVTCAGDVDGTIGVIVTSANNNELGEAPYAWSDGVAGGADALAQDLGPGTYSVTVTDVEGCQDSLTHVISEPGAITFSVLPIGEPACFGETTPVVIDTAFGGTAAGFQDFTFTVNGDGFPIRADTPGETFAGDVTVTVFDAEGCSSEQQFTVGQPPEILIDLPEELVIELGDSLTRLNPIVSPVGDQYQYVWTPPAFLSNDSIRDPVIFPLQDVNYELEVTNQNGCRAFADIFVQVDANRNVYIPNVFQPDGDGRNDDFRVFACRGVLRVNSVQIFNRWGGLVFEADDLPPNCLDGIQLWDGETPNGKRMNGGVYVYMVEVSFLDNITLTYRGDVTLIR